MPRKAPPPPPRKPTMAKVTPQRVEQQRLAAVIRQLLNAVAS